MRGAKSNRSSFSRRITSGISVGFAAHALCLWAVQTPADAAVITVSPGNVTASSEISGFSRLAVYTVDGSGLSGGTHGTNPDGFMWLSSGSSFGGIDPDPAITYDLGDVYTITSFQVWNYNESARNLTSRGVRDVTIEYGTDPSLGSTVAGVSQFARASGNNSYAGQNFESSGPGADFSAFDARYIKFDIASGIGVGNWGDGNTFYGLSEVQFTGTLVPEPSTVLLAGLGLIGLGLRRSRRA